VCFVDDDGVAAFGEVARVLSDERKLLEDGNDDGDGVAQRVGELLGIVIDFITTPVLCSNW